MDSVDALTTGLIDYAGLFPPAKLGMRAAIGNYSEYLNGADSRALGRFILPIEHLDEFSECAAEIQAADSGSIPWRISVLVEDNVTTALDKSTRFNQLHAASGKMRCEVDAIELPYSRLSDIADSDPRLRETYDFYFEIGAGDDVERAIPQLKAAGVRAKIRTGGVTESAFPTPHRVLRFLRACCTSGIAFKATAGLHHPVRAQYPLTYEPGSRRSTMFGFLNVFLAAACMWSGADDSVAAKILSEEDPSAFAFTDSAISWRGLELSAHRIAEARRAFAISFGSCSFCEPVDELDLLLKGAPVR